MRNVVTTHAISGSAPVPLTGYGLPALSAWVAECRDHYVFQGRRPTHAALVRLAGHAAPAGKYNLVMARMRALFEVELAAERETLRAQIWPPKNLA
jgi:hypothetical protein